MSSTVDLVGGQSVGDLTVGEEKPKTFITMTSSERFKFVKEVITVEPIIAFYVLAAVICSTSFDALETEKACKVDAGINATICDAILAGEHANYSNETAVQVTLRANMHSWNLPIQSIMPMLLILFLGSYSDRHHIRKPFILMPILGELFSLVGCILSVVFFDEWPLVVLGVVQTVVPSFFGSLPLFIMAVYSYVADVSSLEMRTLRIGVAQIVLNVCILVGQLLGAKLYTAFGYIPVFITSGVLFVLALLYGFFVVKEAREPIGMNNPKGLLVDVFDPHHVVDTFSLVVKKNPGNNRLHIGIVLLVFFIARVVGIGEAGQGSLFTQSVFLWKPETFTQYVVINSGFHLIGTTIGVALFTKVFLLSDYNCINLSFLNLILSNVIFVFSKTATIFYVGVAISVFGGLNLIGIRSLTTKIVSEDNLGKIQSLAAICEALSPALASPLYNTLYTNTIESLPSAYFILSIVLLAFATALVIWLYKMKSKKDQKTTNGTAEMKKKEDAENTNGMQLNQTTHI